MLKKFCLLFVALSLLVIMTPYDPLFIEIKLPTESRDYTMVCGNLPDIYRSKYAIEKYPKYANYNCDFPLSGSTNMRAVGFPAFYIYISVWGKKSAYPALWYPLYLIINVVWISGMSLALSYILQKIMAKKKKGVINTAPPQS